MANEGKRAAARDEGLIERWQARQEQLASRLKSWGARPERRRIDWQRGRIEWVDEDDEPIVVGEARALCSYSRDEESLLMAWANEEERAGAPVVPPIPDVPELIENCTEAEAWMWAMRLAEESGATYLYRVASPGFLVFMALSTVSSLLETSEIPEGSATAFVIGLLGELEQATTEKSNGTNELRRLFQNHSDSLRANRDHLMEIGADPILLHRTADMLDDLAQGFAARRFGLLRAAPPTTEQLVRARDTIGRIHTEWLRHNARRDKHRKRR